MVSVHILSTSYPQVWADLSTGADAAGTAPQIPGSPPQAPRYQKPPPECSGGGFPREIRYL